MALHALAPNWRAAAPVAAAPAPAPAPSSAPPAYNYSLEMDPEVVAAHSEYTQGIADLNSEPVPSYQAPSTAQYDLAVKHSQELEPIQLEALSHQNEINKRQILNSLAARGMLRSGETGYLQGEQARSYGLATDSVHRNIRWQQESAAAAQAAATQAASQAYAQASAARAHGIVVSTRDLQNHVNDAYINAYNRVIANPALYLGADQSFDPRKFLSQIPGG